MASLKHHEADQEQKGFFTRLFESIAESRMRHVQHQIGRYTDELERLKRVQDDTSISPDPRRHH